MGVNGGLYKTVLVLHILSATVGFGTVFLNGLYALDAKRRPPREGLAVAEANFAVSGIASWVIFLVFILGAGLVGLSDGAWTMGSFWVSTSMVAFIGGIGISHGLLLPNERRMLALERELLDLEGAKLDGPPEQAVELADRGRRAAALGTVLNILVVFILYLMVFKPGN
ncbi:MAG TPA: DUF2269 family protein [Acidimicrobiales bacterium]|nr:DUF2269 family protein [Acidimicrobiales bacterium]